MFTYMYMVMDICKYIYTYTHTRVYTGHHAGRIGVDVDAGGCGFCVLNTVAIAAMYALQVRRFHVCMYVCVYGPMHHSRFFASMYNVCMDLFMDLCMYVYVSM